MSNYLTDEQLIERKYADIEAGYVAYNGHVFTRCEANSYNAYHNQLNKEKHIPTREFLLDQRHRMFCLITGM